VIPSSIPVFDPKAPTSQRALAELSKKATRGALIAIARWSTGSDADAEDLVSSAILAVLDPENAPWVSQKRTFLSHMSYLMRHVWDEDMRRARVKREVIDENVTSDLGTVGKEPPADDELHRRRSLRVLRELGEELMTAIGEQSPVARKCYQLGAAGVEDAKEQAGLIGCSIDAIYQARDTLKRHARRIRDEYDQAEERRMKDLREGTGTMRREDEP